ncbi:MAG: hypothetical protein RL328_1738 [Acidobacteriota bacterium]|jgi:hypothetical protein
MNRTFQLGIVNVDGDRFAELCRKYCEQELSVLGPPRVGRCVRITMLILPPLGSMHFCVTLKI